MRVLMISNDPSLLAAPGRELGDVAVRHVAYGERVERLDIVVLTRSGGTAERQLSANVRAVPTASSAKIFYARDAVRAARQLVGEGRVDLVVTQDPFLTATAGRRLAKIFKSKLLVHLHGDFLENRYLRYEGLPVRLLLPAAKRNIRAADAVRAVSPGIGDKVVRLGVPAERVHVLPTPVDVGKFSKPDADRVAALQKKYAGQRLATFIGRLEPIKNLPMLIRAFADVAKKNDAARLVLAGDGSQRAVLERQAQRLGCADRVTFLGQVGHAELAAYLAASAVAVLPSYSESYGKVILEAAGAGVPTVATATTGASGLIDDGQDGYLVPIDDADAFAEKLGALLADADLAETLGRAARERAAQLPGWQASTAAVVDLWESIV